MKNTNKKTVFVGVSGGVDSSVSAALLKQQGYHVIGVFIRTWQPDWIECTWQDERRDAMRVCAHLDIPFVELDLEKEYKEGVADYMIREYQAGRTPNPDVMCNREVKFGGFLSWARKHGADYIATGHYAQRKGVQGDIYLLRGQDTTKDQSYFLWTLEQEQLKYILFPVGTINKKQVRKLAKKYRLPTAYKKDSQGICFIGEIDMKEFLGHYIKEQEGLVKNIKGETIGKHKGVLFYTIGERHGFDIQPSHKGINDEPYYVIAKDITQNYLIVSQYPDQDSQQDNIIELKDVIDNQNCIQNGMELEVQIRYRGEVKKVIVEKYEPKKTSIQIKFSDIESTLSPGQSIVFYRGEECLGGGIVV